jgi:hypothetical protein
MYILPIYNFQLDVKIVKLFLELCYTCTQLYSHHSMTFRNYLGEGIIAPLVCTDNKNIYISNLAVVLHDISSISMIV